MKKSLIVGMNIGQLYQQVLTELAHDVVTVDLYKTADFSTVRDAVAYHGKFETVHICTPNFTHESIAREVASYAGIVFIEKPGLINSTAWEQLVTDFPATRFMMVKNNQWRDNIDELKTLANAAISVKLSWINRNRVPSPGSWFTTRDLAWGGVSRDLMPHLLSLYIALSNGYESNTLTSLSSAKNHVLENLLDTEYGQANPNGTYDVDDRCTLSFQGLNKTWELAADWKSDLQEDRGILFEFPGGNFQRFELGLCPESAYKAMIQHAMENLSNDMWWTKQYNTDMWIHETISKL